jgi:hypothetical protein
VQAALIAGLVLLATLPAARNAFVSLDDGLYLTNISAVSGLTLRGMAFAFTSVSTLYWHPLTWLSHEVDAGLFGANPAGHHLTSVLLHAIAAGRLFLLLRRLGAGVWGAAGGALLWALHPLRVESFAWVAERKDVLCALFFIATVLAYLRYAGRPSGRRYAAWIGLGALALMSKPVAVCLAPILLLLDYWPLRRESGLVQLLKEKLPLLGMTAAVMALTVYGQKVSGSMSHLADVPLRIRLANAPISYARYIGKMLCPVNLSCFYAYDRHPAEAWVAPSAIGLSAVSVLAVWQRRRRPWLLVGWLWFLIALLPNIGLLQAGRQSIADRFTNLAMIGVAIAAVFTVSEGGYEPFPEKSSRGVGLRHACRIGRAHHAANWFLARQRAALRACDFRGRWRLRARPSGSNPDRGVPLCGSGAAPSVGCPVRAGTRRAPQQSCECSAAHRPVRSGRRGAVHRAAPRAERYLCGRNHG